jgi:uncharacterized damage-inducible protein DinB
MTASGPTTYDRPFAHLARSVDLEDTMGMDLIAKQFAYDLMGVERNAADLDHADSMASPPGGGSSINWVLGHVLASRNSLMGLSGGAPVCADERLARLYDRGTTSPTDDAIPLPELLDLLRASQAPLVAHLTSLTDEQLMAPVEGFGVPGVETLGEGVAFLHFHEAYHVGQIGAIRRALGKPGAIA